MTPQIAVLIEKIRALKANSTPNLPSAAPSCASAWSMAVSRLRKNCFAAIVELRQKLLPYLFGSPSFGDADRRR